MRILHVIPSLSSTEGGPSRALPLVSEALSNRGIDVVTATTDDAGPGHRSPELCEKPTRTAHSVIHHFPKQTEFYKVSLPLSHWVSRQIYSFDAVHIHALFSHASVSAAKIARRAGVPYIIRPLGVLNEYGVQNRRKWLKKASLRFREGPLLRDAAAIHFTSREEQEQADQLGIPMKGEIISLGISFPAPPHPVERSAPPFALYLSRLDPKKNLEGLLHAWSRIPPQAKENWMLRIAGSGDPDYVHSLRELAAQLEISSEVEWLGHIDGEEKAVLFREASLFVLPSFSENFGIAAAEAMGAGLPCLLSPGVAVGKEAASEKACFLAEPDQGSLTEALSNILPAREDRENMGSKGREFAHRHYGVARMGESLESLYRKITRQKSIS